ncbi:DUF4407 domain-containing protein [Thermopolyspora sp. NPDC052614]|uniref:DUF4407 domain-containing protein n=1 Tax=Thermopolyspora sp. NPDC052614 TaxID=3155682 RepID=UPI00343FEA6D
MTEAPLRTGTATAATAWQRLALGRRLRVLAGVDEKMLDKVPLERTRFTGLGGVVLGTAAVAGLSMWFAVGQVLGGWHVAMLIPVVMWALIVLNLDRWLVSAATGMWQRRVLMMFPRLLMAALLGVVIAEPLVLRVFETAVEQHVKDGREQARELEQARWIGCNPKPPAPPTRRDCDAARLASVGVESRSDTITKLEASARRLETRIDRAEKHLSDLVELARKECVGEDGEGLSGKRGEGPLCIRNRADAADFEARSGLDKDRTRLNGLRDQIARLRGPLAAEEADFEARLDRAIRERLDDLPTKDDPIGLLERMKALHELTAANPYLFAASWLIRLFLIVIDCLPVLVKLMGGTTAYDRMVATEIRRREEVHAREAELRAKGEIDELDLAAYAADEERRRRRQNIDVARRTTEAQTRARLADLVDQRTQELRLRQNGGPVHEERRNGSLTL